MLALPVGNADNLRIGKIDRKPAGPLEHAAIRLKPPRPARARKEAFGDDNVGPRAGCRQRALLDLRSPAAEQQVPRFPAPGDGERAPCRRTSCPRPLSQRHGLGGDPGEFQQIVAGIARTAISQRYQTPRAVWVGHGDAHLLAIARNQQIGDRGRRGHHARQPHRNQSGKAHPAAPQRKPQAPHGKKPYRNPADLRHQTHRARLAGSEMRNCQQQSERSFHHPPERRARADKVGHQRERDHRHRDERNQRDRNDIGQCAIHSRPVKMEHHDRHQREFDHDPRHEQHHDLAEGRPPPCLLARRKEGAHRCAVRQGDDREHGGEAHLETGANRALGPEQQHKPGGDRHHPQGQGLTPQHQRAQHQQRGDTAADRRHLRPGEQGVSDPRSRARARRKHRQPDPQRQRRPQREQPHDRKIGCGNHCADVEPADRQKVRQPRIAHRRLVGFLDPAAVAAGKRRGDRTRRTRHARPDMDRQRALQTGDPVADRCRFAKLKGADHRAGSGQALKPCGTGKIIGAGQHRARRRHQPGAQSDHSAFAQPGRRAGLAQHRKRDIDAHLARLSISGVAHGERQSHPALGRLILARQHPAFDQHHGGTGDRFGSDNRRARPHGADTKGEDQPASHHRKPQVRAGLVGRTARWPQRLRAERKCRAAGDRGAPMPRGRPGEPREDSQHEHHGKPRRAVEACLCQKAFGPVCQSLRTAGDAGQALRGLPRAQARASGGNGSAGLLSHRNERHIAQRLVPRPACTPTSRSK